jgi:hypothetical protein
MSSADRRARTPLRERRIEVDPTRTPSNRDPIGGERCVTRDDIIGVASLTFGAGVWLVVCPWVLAYTAADTRWNAVVFGALIAVLALVSIAIPARTAALSAVSAAIGVWLFIAGFWLADSGRATWNDWILGTIVFAVGMTGIASGPRRSFLS